MIESLYRPLEWPYTAGRTWIEKNTYLTAAVVIASASLYAIAQIYQRIHRCDALPFDRWSISLGWRQRPTLTAEDIEKLQSGNFQEVIQIYSPEELASRLYEYFLRTPSPFREKELQSLAKHFQNRASLLEMSQKVLPAFKEGRSLSTEDEKALAIQTWATYLHHVLTLVGIGTHTLENISKSLLSSPRFVSTILFNLLAPFASQKIWEGIKDFLPTSLVETGNMVLQHKMKIALASLGLVALLYYWMRLEKGVLINWTENYIAWRKTYKGLDLVPSYQAVTNEILHIIGKSPPGKTGSNIVVYYPSEANSTFGREIGDILAEMTASGRIYDNRRGSPELPFLKDLSIFELDLEVFLTEHRDENAIHQGWTETMKYISQRGNVLVKLTGLSVIEPHLFPGIQQNNTSGQDVRSFPNSNERTLILATLVKLSLQQGRFRCILKLDENQKRLLEKKPSLSRLFSFIRAPDVVPDELEELSKSLYSSSSTFSSLPGEDIRKLFARLKPALLRAPLPPREILDVLQDTLKTIEIDLRRQSQPGLALQKAERDLQSVQQMQKQLLEKFWQQRRTRDIEPLPLLQGLLLVDQFLLPLYGRHVQALKNSFVSASFHQQLLMNVQRRFSRLFGPCTEKENISLLKLPQLLKAKIPGQDLAIDSICTAVRRWRTVPPLDGKPLVVFCAGPAGIGKTTTATELAFQLKSVFGIEETAIRTQESNVKRINLARKKQAGFAGWDLIQADILFRLHRFPTSVIIFEEWNKMDDSEKLCLLELLEGTQNYLKHPFSYGSEPGSFVFVDKRCAIFIITSNLATDYLSKTPPDALEPRAQFAKDQDTVKEEILALFSKEKRQDAQAFISRLDAIIPFRGHGTGESLIDNYLEAHIEHRVLPPKWRSRIKERIQREEPSMEQLQDGRVLQRLIQDAIFKEMEGAVK